MLGIVGFYLYDVALMLHKGELALVRTGSGWHATAGADLTLFGRYPAMPGMLSPGAAVFLLNWDGPSGKPSTPNSRVLETTWPLRWPARLQASVLFVLVPLGLFINLAAEWMLALLGVLYALSAASMLYVLSKREALQLSGKALASIAFDVLACPPFAINLVRRITLSSSRLLCGREFASQVLASDLYARCDAVVVSRRVPIEENAADRFDDATSHHRDGPT